MNTKSKAIVIIAIVALFLPAIASAKTVTLEGVIKGARATMLNTPGPASSLDPLVAAEYDFVLVTSDGFHLLTNLSRSVKVKLLGKDIKVVGSENSNGRIFVRSIESREGDLLYSWAAEHKSSSGNRISRHRGPRGFHPQYGFYDKN